MLIQELDKKLTDKILPDFASVSNPYGLLNPLAELQTLINQTSHLNWFNIKNKILLSKRLSQCLNVLNSSDGIHERIINFYDSLFNNLLIHYY